MDPPWIDGPNHPPDPMDDARQTINTLVNTASAVLADDGIEEVTVASGGISITLKQKPKPDNNNINRIPPLVLLKSALRAEGEEELLNEVHVRSAEMLMALAKEGKPWIFYSRNVDESWAKRMHAAVNGQPCNCQGGYGVCELHGINLPENMPGWNGGDLG